MPRRCRSPIAASMPVTIAFGIRNVPRIERALAEAYRVLRIGGRFLCLEFSTVDVPGLDALYDFYSFNVIPALGRAVTGDAEAYRYLVESIRRFPKPQAFAAHDARRPALPRVSFRPHDRRHRRAAFGLAIVIAGLAHLVRLGRAGFVFAREGVLGLVDPTPLPLPARAALAHCTADRAAGDAALREPARRRAHPARPDLRQARPVPGDAARRGRSRARARSRKPAGQDAAIPAGRSRARRSRRRSASRCATCLRASARRSPPPRSRRCIAPRSRPRRAGARSR